MDYYTTPEPESKPRFSLFCKREIEKALRAGIDKSARLPYKNSEERTTHTVSSSSSSLYLWQSHKNLLSLGWSGGRFFIVLF